MTFPIFTLLIIATEAFAQFPVARTITDESGRKLDVTVISKTDEKILVRRSSDQKEFSIATNKLSPEDRDWLKSLDVIVEKKPDVQKSKLLWTNIPPFEEQVIRIQALALELETKYSLAEDATKIRNNIAKTKSDDPVSIAKLSRFITYHPHASKWPDKTSFAFDLMRLAIINEPLIPLDYFFITYWVKDSIPEQFVEESFEIVTRHAKLGNPRAIIALACARVFTTKNRPLSDNINLKYEYPNNSNIDLAITIKIIKDALQKKPPKDLDTELKRLLATAYIYAGRLREGEEALISMGAKPDMYALNTMARSYYENYELEKSLKWYKVAESLGENCNDQITRIQNEISSPTRQ